jgi:hypothetical protein
MQDVSHLFEILREINSLTTYITDNHNTDILTTENYKIISASDPSKIMKCFDNGWTLYGQCSCRMDSCQKCCELNTWKMLTTSNKIKAKIIGFSVPEQKIIILEIFHDFIDKQNRLNAIYEKYGKPQEIYDKLDKIYEEKTKPKINTNNQKKEEQIYINFLEQDDGQNPILTQQPMQICKTVRKARGKTWKTTRGGNTEAAAKSHRTLYESLPKF